MHRNELCCDYALFFFFFHEILFRNLESVFEKKLTVFFMWVDKTLNRKKKHIHVFH